VLKKYVNLWTYFHSFFFLALGVYLLSMREVAGSAWAIQASAALGVFSFSILLLLQGRSSFSVPNAVSLLRVVTAVGAALLLMNGDTGYGVFAFLALGGISDFFDGLFARRLGSTTFGAKLDMELDAFFIFILAAAARLHYGQGRLVIIAGLLRYGYVFLLPILPAPSEMPRIVRFLSKGACALAVTLLIIITVPVINDISQHFCSIVSVVILCASFVLDAVIRLWLGRGGRLSTRTVVP
jgi:phosphatidylglycerophosphate synthase